MLGAHYRSPLNFSEDALKQSTAAVERLQNSWRELTEARISRAGGAAQPELRRMLGGLKQRFSDALDDDFNTADAISAIFELVREINSAVSPNAHPTKALAEGCRALYLELSDVLGIPFTEKKDELTPEQEALFNARKDARKAKNWAESDRIRDELKAQGILVEDTPQGMKWKRI